MKTQETITIKAKDQTKKALSSVNGSLKKMSGILLNAKTAVAGLVGVGGFGAIVIQSARAADSLAKTSDKLGLTTQALGGLRHAAELTGVSSNTMDMALQRMVRRLSEAANGTGEAKDAIKELGLNAQTLTRLAPDKAFQKIAKAMEGTATQGDKVRLAMKFFDSEGVALVNTLNLQEKGLRAAAEEAEIYGVALSRADASKIERANDAMKRIQVVVKGVGTTIAIHLAPFIEVISKKFSDAAKESKGFKTEVFDSIKGIIHAIGVLRDAIHNIEIAWQVVKLGAVAAFDGIISGIAWADKAISNFIDKMPGLSAKPSADLEIWAIASGMAVKDVAFDLEQLLNATKPSEAMQATLQSISEQAEKVSQKMVAAKAAAKFTDDDQSALDLEFNAASAHTDRMIRLIEMETAAEKTKAALELKAAKDKINVAKGLTGNLATLMASSSKKEFEVGKKFALANALVKGYEAITSSYAAGAKVGGPYLGALYAATAAIATKVQIDNIKNQSFAGGGGVSVSGGAGGGVATGANLGGGAPTQAETNQNPVASGGTTTVNLIGRTASFTGEQVNEVFDAIADALERGDRVLFSSTSRQALELNV